jgi:hypothetical protein
MDRFNECARGGYNNTETYVSWKIVDGIMYFQCSKEVEDWKKNLDCRLVKTEIGLTHKGFDEAYQEVFRMIMQNPVTGYCGYSHGAVIASRASAATGKRSTVFGCPNFMYNPTKETLDRFWNVEFVQNKNDIVANGLFWMRKGRNIIMTIGHATRGLTPIWQWLSGHTPSEYRQRMQNV